MAHDSRFKPSRRPSRCPSCTETERGQRLFTEKDASRATSTAPSRAISISSGAPELTSKRYQPEYLKRIPRKSAATPTRPALGRLADAGLEASRYRDCLAGGVHQRRSKVMKLQRLLIALTIVKFVLVDISDRRSSRGCHQRSSAVGWRLWMRRRCARRHFRRPECHRGFSGSHRMGAAASPDRLGNRR